MRITVTKGEDGKWSARGRANRPGEKSFAIVAGVGKMTLKLALKEALPKLDAARNRSRPS